LVSLFEPDGKQDAVREMAKWMIIKGNMQIRRGNLKKPEYLS